MTMVQLRRKSYKEYHRQQHKTPPTSFLLPEVGKKRESKR